MSFQGQRLSTIGRLRQALQRMIFGRGGTLRRWWGIDTNIDYENEVGDAGRSDIVSSLVGWKQNVFPEAPLRLREMDADGKLQPVMDHPLLDLMKRPTTLYDGMALWKATIWDYAIDGNAFWMIVPSRAGKLMELHYLPRYMIRPGSNTEQKISNRYWDYTPSSTVEQLPANRVLHFRDGIDPEDVRLGCSPLKNLYREMYTDAAAANVVASLLRNRAMPSAIISPKEGTEFDQGNIEETRQYVQEMFTGDNRGQPLVLGGATSIDTFGYSPADLEVAEVRYMSEERLCAALNVPGIVVGLGSGMRRSTFANVGSAREMAWENGMLPMLRDLAETLNTVLLPMADPDAGLQFDFDIKDVRVLQEDQTRLSQRNRIGVSGGWVTVAEARESEGRGWQPADEVYLRSPVLTAVPVGEVQMPAAEPADVEEPEEDAPVGVDADAGEEGEMERSLPAGGQLRVEVDEFMQDVIDGFDEAVVEATSEYGRQIEGFFEDVAGEIYDGNSDSMSKWVTIAVETDEDLASLADEVDAVFDTVKVNEMRDANLTPIYEDLTQTIMERAASTVNSSLGVSVNLPDLVQRQVIADGGKRVGLIDVGQQNKDALFRALHKARSEGMGVDDAAKLIREQLSAGPYTNAGVDYRAHMVARTEAKHAQRVSALALYDEAGWEVQALDGQLGDASDPDCIARNGKTFTVEAAASETDSAVTHPNCTLSWLPVVKNGGSNRSASSQEGQDEGDRRKDFLCPNCGAVEGVYTFANFATGLLTCPNCAE